MDDLLEQLTDLFHRLRGAGVPLGVSELMRLQRALHHGFGLSNQDALKSLCRIVWLVSIDDQPLFNDHFKNAITLTLPIQSKPPVTAIEETIEADHHQTNVQQRQVNPQRPKEKPKKSSFRLPPTSSGSDTQFAPDNRAELAKQVEDVHIQAQVVLTQTSAAETLMMHQKLSTREFLPISRRELQQSWRYLRRMVRSGPAVELDSAATVRNVAQNGYLMNPVMVPRRTNQSTILLLLDQKGSMVPFHFLCRALADTATAAGSFGQVGVYHFHNVLLPIDKPGQAAPTGHYRDHLLYITPQCVDARPVSEVMRDFDAIRPDALIFSDAGAARKTWNAARIEDTALFLFQLRTLGVEQFAWLNPLPQERWRGTSAEAIAKFAPMFPLSHSGFRQAIHTLNSGSRYTLKLATT